VKSGLGWIGKNGNLISKKSGSFFFLATLILDLDLDYDMPFSTSHCGTCTKCIDACPTDAIRPDKVVNGSQCISYFTIELKEAFSEQTPHWNDWIFGCDICQDVCPWNRFSKPHITPSFNPSAEWIQWYENDYNLLSQELFSKVFSKSAIKRTKFDFFIRNQVWSRK
jgi:epoxyqueuosine reductase